MMSSKAERQPPAAIDPAAERTDGQRIAAMTAAHFFNDSYGQYLPILLPLLAASIGFSLSLAAVVVTAYTITSSIVQPFLGHIADRHATRLISVLGIMGSAIGASLLGVSPSFIVLVLLAVLAGFGTASFHPQGAAMVVAISGKRKATMMSIYLFGGSAGFAVGPLVVARVAHTSLHATPLLMIPGLLMALAFYFFAPQNWSPGAAAGSPAGPSLWAVLREHRRVLALLLGVVVLRSLTQQGLSTFLPFYYKHLGHTAGYAAAVLSVLGLTGAFGGLLGGFLADRFSQRPVIVISLLLAGPLLVALPHLSGAPLFIDAGLSGVLLLSSWNVLTVKGQQLLNKNVGMASGLMLGFSGGLGGLGVIPMGIIGDRVGTLPILTFLGLLAPVAGLLALTLPE